MRFACVFVEDVGAEYGHIAVLSPSVEGVSPGLYIVVAHVSCVISHVVHHLRGDVGREGVDIVVVINRRLSLQYVAVVEQDYIVAIFFSVVFYYGRYA